MLKSNFDSTTHIESMFNNAKLDSASFRNSIIKNSTTFEEASLEYSNFDNSIIDNVNLSKSVLNHASFINAKIKDANFSNRWLKNVVFTNAIIENSDFRGVRGLEVLQFADVKYLRKNIAFGFYRFSGLRLSIF